MAFKLVDRVRETTISPGTGTATLLGAALGYQTFSAGVGANNTTYYVIADQSGANWEVGYGTVGAGGTTLARTTVLSSSNAGSLVNFSSGTQDVWVDYTATKAVFQDINGLVTVPTFATSSTTSTTPVLSFNASNTSFASGATISGSYLQFLLQNKSGTAGASTNYVLSNDLGTDSTYYGEFGMNSSVFSASTPADFFSLNNGVYFSGHDGDVIVGSGNGFKHYMAWGTTGQSAHVINASGALGFSTNLGTTPALSGTTGYGTAGQVPVSAGSAGAVAWSSTPTLTGTNFTGIPISTGISGLGTGIATWLATPSSANLLAAMTDETGTGSLVFANTPTLVTPNIGAATGTSLSVTGSLTSTVATGTAPLVVSSTTLVSNLNAQYLNGQLGSYYTTAGNLTGTIPSAVLGNSTLYIGTTAIALNRASANLALTGLLSGTFQGSTSGSVQLIPAAVAGTGTVLTMPATTGTIVTTGDTGTVTNTMLAGSIANAKLLNSSVTINGSAVSLGGSITVTATASNALTISSPLSGTSYNGSAAVTLALAAGYGDTQNPFASKTANYFLAAPNGAAGAPTFRAIVAADIPTLNQNTTGTAANVTGIVALANGGSGQSTAQAAMNAFAGAVTSGSYLRGNGTNVVMSTIQAADVPTLNQNTTGTAANVTGTVAIANGGTGATTAGGALTNLGAYAASNPNGYTSNTGTVTSITVSAGTGMSGGGTVTTSGTVTLNNAGVTSLTAGTGISVSASTGGVTITNSSPNIYVGIKGQTFTANGTFTIPTGVTALKITVVGGGGGGGSTSSAPIGGSASGGAAISFLTGLTPGATLAVTVGAGGTGGGSYNTGGTGGTSSVASGTQTISTISATGGASARGSNQGAWIPSTGPGIGSGGTINIRGEYGTSALGDFGQGFYWGGTGGSSIFGGGGIGNNGGVGGIGLTGGGAGGSATGAFVGADGGAGLVIFEW